MYLVLMPTDTLTNTRFKRLFFSHTRIIMKTETERLDFTKNNPLVTDGKKITYRPEWRKFLGSVTAVILLQQIFFHWLYEKNKNPFYKFKEPCKHPAYKKGDSWTEELGFSRAEFDTALKKIAHKVKKGTEKQTDKPVYFWVNTERITFYEINEIGFNQLMNEIYNPNFTKSENLTLHDKEEIKIFEKRESNFSQSGNQDLDKLHRVLNKENITKTKVLSENGKVSNESPQEEIPQPSSPNDINYDSAETARNFYLNHIKIQSHMKVVLSRIPEANIQAEFYHMCKVNKLKCLLEYKFENCQFDAVIYDSKKEVKIIVEFKSYKTNKKPKTDTKQINKYSKFGIPIILITRMSDLDWSIEECQKIMGVSSPIKKVRRKFPMADLFDGFNLVHKELFTKGDMYTPYIWGKGNHKAQKFAHMRNTCLLLEEDIAIKYNCEKSEVEDYQIIEGYQMLMRMAKQTGNAYLISNIEPLGLYRNYNRIKQDWLQKNAKVKTVSDEQLTEAFS